MLSIDIEWLNGLQERFGIRIYSGQIYASIFFMYLRSGVPKHFHSIIVTVLT